MAANDVTREELDRWELDIKNYSFASGPTMGDLKRLITAARRGLELGAELVARDLQEASYTMEIARLRRVEARLRAALAEIHPMRVGVNVIEVCDIVDAALAYTGDEPSADREEKV